MKILCILALCGLMLSACTPKADAETAATPTKIQATAESTTVPVETEPSAAEPMKFTLYTPNDTLDGFIETEVETDEINGSSVVEKLIEAGILNAEVSINTIKMEDSHLYIDLNAAFIDQLLSQGSTGERFLMGSIVNTFLNAFCAEYLSITVDGEIIESGHVVYDFPMGLYR